MALKILMRRVKYFLIHLRIKKRPITKLMTPPTIEEAMTKSKVKKKPTEGPLNLVKIKAPPRTKKVVGMKKIVIATKMMAYKAIP